MSFHGPASDAMVRTALTHALSGVGIREPPSSIERRENVYESTHRSDVLDCQVGELALPAILAKYGPIHDSDHLGLRHGLAYEAEVYRHVLAELRAPARFFGSYQDPRHGLSWVFVEYLDEGWQLDLGPETAIVDAAAMLGELQRSAARAVSPAAQAQLNRYDAAYFQRCLSQAETQTSRWRERVPAFHELERQFRSSIPRLLESPQTVVHGEFTPHNVVWAHEQPRIVDWEQAALGAGEIDLAALTDDWDEDLVAAATAAYLDRRWPGGAPHHFAATLDAARLYWLFRWLSDPEQAGTDEEIAWLAERASQVSAQ